MSGHAHQVPASIHVAAMPTADVSLRRILAEDRDHRCLTSVRCAELPDGRARMVCIAQGHDAMALLELLGVTDAVTGLLLERRAALRAELLLGELSSDARARLGDGAPAEEDLGDLLPG